MYRNTHPQWNVIQPQEREISSLLTTWMDLKHITLESKKVNSIKDRVNDVYQGLRW